MTPERWRRIEDLFHVAVAQPPAARSAFLEQACANDPDLKRAIEALIRQESGGFLEQPPIALAAQPMTDPNRSMPSGRRLGVFEIQSLIGAGGMGEVYRARDTKLGRGVAIKILPRAFTADPERLGRFEREARVLATLNHPNIAAIYGLQDVDGVPALVLELVEGKTLAERLGAGSHRSRSNQALSIDEATAIARQLVEALDVAHQKGIVHRDLKPANIKITPEGVVKVLDFGLAKAVAGDRSRDRSEGPAVTTDGTREGVILGTPAYMSPEQARGLPVDKRTDIWAFGCVLYEMLTGRPAFAGETVTDTLAAIIERDPDWGALPTGTPPVIGRLLHRCLDKDPKRRLRDIGDVRVDLDDAIATPLADRGRSVSGPPQLPDPARATFRAPASRLARATAVAALVALTAAVTLWLGARARAPLSAPETRLEIVTPPTDDPVSLAVAPDGRQVVFAGKFESGSRLWIRRFNAVADRALVGTDGGTFPFWSPDSRSIGFFAGGKLKRIDIESGSVQAVVDAEGGRGGAWNIDGTIVFQPQPGNGPLVRVAASGGEPVVVTREPQQSAHRFPQFLSDGRHLLYFATGTPAVRGVYVSQMDGSEPKRQLDADGAAVYSPTGHMLFVRLGVLLAQPFDARRATVTGDAFPVVGGMITSGTLGGAPLSASAAGPIVYRTGSAGGERQFAWFDRSGREVEKVGTPVPDVLSPAMSTDGRFVAVHRNTGGNGDIWILDVERGVFSRLTSSPESEFHPTWAPDGRRMVFSVRRNNSQGNLVEVPLADARTETSLLESPQAKWATDWSPDSRVLLYVNQDPKMRTDIWALPMEQGGKPFPVVQTDFSEENAQFSSDGKWITYQSDETGRSEVYVQPFMRSGNKLQISSDGGAQPRWRRDGKELFYVALDGKLIAVPIRPSSERLDAGAPVSLFATRMGAVLPGNSRQQYMVSPDGQRFLMNTLADDMASPITVILNWKATP